MEIDKLLKLRLMDNSIITLMVGLFASSYIVLKGTNFSANEVSLILLIVSVVAIFQNNLEKIISTDRLLSVILYTDVLWGIVFIFLIMGNIRLFIISDHICIAISTLLYRLRYTRLQEATKVYYNTSKYMSYSTSVIAGANIFGIMISALLLMFIEPEQLILYVGIITWITGMTLTFCVNRLSRKILASDPDTIVHSKLFTP